MSSHRLEIESDRRTRPISISVDNRKCQVCTTIEDEHHFVLECSMFIALRKKYISRFFLEQT